MQEILRKASTPLVALLLAATLFMAYTVSNVAFATHQPADKVTAAGSTLQTIEQNGEELLLREEMKVATPTDLILSVTAECAINTLVGNLENGTSEAQGQVKVYVTIDDIPVPVSDPTPATMDGGDGGRVVFCDRLHRQTTQGLNGTDEQDNRIEQYLETRTANGFNWIALNPARFDANGDNVLEIEVWGEFMTRGLPDATGGAAEAEAYVGNRTLVVEPVKMTNDEHTAPTGEGTASPNPAASPGGKKP